MLNEFLGFASFCIKLYNGKERLYLSTDYYFRDGTIDEYRINEIDIHNTSKIPIIISYWELIWVKRHYLKKETIPLDYGDPGDRRNIRIEAYETHTLTFTADDYFEWGHQTTTNGRLFLKLCIAGRSHPVMLKVYNPKKSIKQR